MDGIDYSLFSGFRLLDVIDIILVAIIIYYIYSLIRGTIAVNILIGVALFYGVYIVVKQMHMRLLTEIFGGFISVGSIALIVVFQQEIRRFLLHVGKNISMKRKKVFWSFIGNKKAIQKDLTEDLKPGIEAC
jgi:DNA integrity scanning protein DisA with diadenylate cyclase activity